VAYYSIQKMNELSGKVALVTGGSRGIGRSIALSLAAAGADIVINFLTHTVEAQGVEAKIRASGRRSLCVQADVSVASEVERLAHEVHGAMGTVDILVNNAGIARQQSLDQVTESDWDELMAVNLKSCFLVTQAFLPAMRTDTLLRPPPGDGGDYGEFDRSRSH